MTCIEQLLRDFGMARFTIRLEYGFAIPVEPKPVEAGNDRINGGLRRTGPVSIFNTQQSLAAVVAGIKPVEQGCASTTNVEKTRW